LRAATLLPGVLLVLAARPVLADEDEAARVREVTIQDVIDLGLAYNLGLESSRLDVLLRRLDVDRESAAWDVGLTASAGGGEELIPSRSLLNGADVVDTDNANFAFGLTKPTRLGPSLGLDWRSNRSFSNSAFSTINPAYDSALEVSLTVPLLQGWGRAANESALRASRLSLRSSQYQLLDDVATTVDEIAAAFWNLVYLQDRVKVLEKSVELAREIEDNERRKARPDIGRSTQLDVQTAEAERKRRETAVIQGRLDALNASDDLRLLVFPFTGRSEDNILLKAVEIPRDTVDVEPLDTFLARALRQRPDLLRTDAELQRLQESIVASRDSLKPQLDLVGSVVWRGVDDNLADSASAVVQGDTPSFNANLNLSWVLGRRAQRAAVRRAELDLEQAKIQRREQVSGIVVEVRRAHRALRTAIREIEATKAEVESATAALAGEQKRLAKGIATILDVSRLEENLRDAELRLLQARTTLERALVGLEKASGTVLEHFRVGIDADFAARRAKGP